jgi:hypothetical protein
MVKWAENGNNLHITPALLGKIFTRFFYTLNNMDMNEVLKRDAQLGEWMHRMVVAFLHAVVVLEALDKINLKDTYLSLKNPITSDSIFFQNLSKLNLKNQDGVEEDKVSKGKSDITKEKTKSTDQLSFSWWMLSCPILKFFLNSGPHYSKLNSVYIRQRPTKETKKPNKSFSHDANGLNDARQVLNDKMKKEDSEKLIEKLNQVDDPKNIEKGILNKFKVKLIEELGTKYNMSNVTLHTVYAILRKVKNVKGN